MGKIIHLREDRVQLLIYLPPTMYLEHMIGFRVMGEWSRHKGHQLGMVSTNPMSIACG